MTHQNTRHLYLCFDRCTLFGLATPRALGSIQTASLLLQLHSNLTSPPSLWPVRELRKYHYPYVFVFAFPSATGKFAQ